MRIKLVLLTCVILSCFACKKTEEKVETPVVKPQVKHVPKIEFGFNLDEYQVVSDTIKSGDSFGKLLANNHISYQKIEEIVGNTKEVFDVRKLNIGKPYTILKSKDSVSKAQAFIYQPNKIDYVVFNFEGDSLPKAYKGKKPVTLVEKTASGVITSSLSEAMDKEGLSIYMAHELSNIYAWSIDFFRLQKGDRYKIVYTERYISDSIYAGVKDIKAALFEHNKKSFYAFDFLADSTQVSDYYDETGKTLRSQFLKAPVKYSRISSRYSRRRFHPVQKRWKAHLGTDYAAPRGTPILATANGTVVKASYTRGNGKYVKIRHNGTYSTQYLHMSRRAVKAGETVRQGDVIGYVGSTGLATGPHVCYRFWKNGVQVDPLRQKLPSAAPLKDEVRGQYLEFIKDIKEQLDSIEYKSSELDNAS